MMPLKSRCPNTCVVPAGYPKWLSFTGDLANHWLVEAMKSAFALRSHMADPGPCNATACAQDIFPVLNSTLSSGFADSLRYTPLFLTAIQYITLYLVAPDQPTFGQRVALHFMSLID